MKLIWLKVATEILIGEVDDRSSVTTLISERTFTLKTPMMMQYVNMPAPAQVIGRKNPEMILGFKLAPIPCSEIFIKDVSYAGMIDAHDPVAVTYERVKGAIREQADSPLMVNQ